MSSLPPWYAEAPDVWLLYPLLTDRLMIEDSSSLPEGRVANLDGVRKGLPTEDLRAGEPVGVVYGVVLVEVGSDPDARGCGGGEGFGGEPKDLK